MRYRRLDSSGDMCFGAQQEDFYRDVPQAVAQAVWTRLRLWRGEWFLDTTEGTPWLQAALGERKRKTIEPAIRARILGTQGCEGLEAFDCAIEPDSRTATISATINTIYGQTAIRGTL